MGGARATSYEFNKESAPMKNQYEAFKNRDAAASAEYHQHKIASRCFFFLYIWCAVIFQSESLKYIFFSLFSLFSSDGDEMHGNAAGPYLKSLIYGGLDGIITTFATVTSVAGANLPPLVIIVVGIAHLFADGLAMGLGDALSSQAELDYNNTERLREKWEMEVNMDLELQEMVELYKARGIEEDDAMVIWHTLAKYPEAFLDLMMVEELQLMPPDENDNPWVGGVWTCLAFIAFGTVPLIPFLLAMIPLNFLSMTHETQMNWSVIVTVITLFILGILKSKLVEMGSNWMKSGLVMAGLGSLAAFISYILGVGLNRAFGIDM